MHSNEKRKQLIEILSEGPFVKTACKKAGIDRSVYYRWREKYPKFREEVDAAIKLGRESMAEVAEIGLFKKVKEGEAWAIRFALQNNDQRYVPKRTTYIFPPLPKRERSPGDPCEECGHQPTSEDERRFLEKIVRHYQETAPEEYEKDTRELIK